MGARHRSDARRQVVANWQTYVRLRATDTARLRQLPWHEQLSLAQANYAGIDLSGVTGTAVTNLTWDAIKRLRDTVKVRLVLKGILTHEDTRLAVDAGVDGIVVSNHGGRTEDGVSATIDVLPEIVAAPGPMPVLVDSGFRRGSDIVKALAIGARPYASAGLICGGLAHSASGVERVLTILRGETRTAMQQVGAPTIKDLTPAMVRRV